MKHLFQRNEHNAAKKLIKLYFLSKYDLHGYGRHVQLRKTFFVTEDFPSYRNTCTVTDTEKTHHVKVHADSPEERKSWGKLVHIQPSINTWRQSEHIDHFVLLLIYCLMVKNKAYIKTNIVLRLQNFHRSC